MGVKRVTASYPKEQYGRGQAWNRLLLAHPNIPHSHWQKDHTADEWRWATTEKCGYRYCHICRPRGGPS